MPYEEHFPVPDEYLREIGQIVVNWSDLESTVVHTMTVVLFGEFAPDNRALALLVHMSWPQKLDALEAMLKILDEDLADFYKNKVRPLLKEASDKRNTVIHHRWFNGKDGVKRFNIKARGEIKVEQSLIDIQELKGVSLLILEAEWALIEGIGTPIISRDVPHEGQ